ncbi:MAG: hypothetical protein LC104_16035 [Bacteroidales bacterium]|nr:hypothetical protein [Bacteroidales bacterium]
MDEYVCVTLAAVAGEGESAFANRLTGFWTHVLRTRPDDYARIYAEATAFERDGDCVTRQYMVEPGVVETLTRELTQQAIAWHPVDLDDLYTKSEASSSDWFQIEH